MEAGSLWLTGEKPLPPAEGRLVRGERRYGRFNAAVPLPRDADAETAAAELDQGVLTVHLPRRPTGGRRQIPIERKDAAA